METPLLQRTCTYICIAIVVLLSTQNVHASVAGTNADKVKVSVETKQGGTWIEAREDKTDRNGVLEFENVLPGKYKFTIDKDDLERGQTLGLELRLLDKDGRAIKNERADVDVYIYGGKTKIFIARYQTDKDGWLDLAGITSGTVYEIDVREEMRIKSKDNQPRIKMKAKINGSDWFKVAYKRIKNGWLEVEDVLPGSYKFKYKSKDVTDINQPFNLKARVRNSSGDNVKNAKVKLYAYPFGEKTFVAEIKTDKKGWIQLPGVVPNMKYKIRVKD